MSNYREWCRLCGDLDGSAKISSNVLFIIELIVEVCLFTSEIHFSAQFFLTI